jgi:hypothetical protein
LRVRLGGSFLVRGMDNVGESAGSSLLLFGLV